MSRGSNSVDVLLSHVKAEIGKRAAGDQQDVNPMYLAKAKRIYCNREVLR